VNLPSEGVSARTVPTRRHPVPARTVGPGIAPGLL